MPNLFWNPLSITYLIELILISVIAGYLFFRLGRAKVGTVEFRSNLLLFVTFFVAVIGMSLQLFSVTLDPVPANFSLPWIGPISAIEISGFVLFAFYFQRAPKAKKFGEGLLIFFLLVFFGLETFIAVQRHQLLAQGYVDYRSEWASIPLSVVFVLGPIFFAQNFVRNFQGTYVNRKPPGLFAVLGTLFSPHVKLERDASANRAFFYTSIMPVALFAVMLMRSVGLIDWTVTLVLGCWILLLMLASFALTYLNFVPEHSSFRSRLVGASLTAVLMILCCISWLVGAVYVEDYRDPLALQSESAMRFEPNFDGGYILSKVSYEFDAEIGDKISDISEPIVLPFDFTFYGKEYTSFYAHNWGMIGFDHMPRPRDIQFDYGPQAAIFLVVAEIGMGENLNTTDANSAPESGVFVKHFSGSTIVTWNQLTSIANPDDVYTFQLKLYETGAIELVYADIPASPMADVFRPASMPTLTGIVPPYQDRAVSIVSLAKMSRFAEESAFGIVDAHQMRFMQYLNRIYAPVAYFILAASLIVLLVFPWIFSINLNNPLQELLFGVRQILKGNLNTKIDVQYHDEIGFLASSFNEMAAAQHDLVHNLEQKVIETTEEAADYSARNARLEERNHLSRELHDAVSQSLFSANLVADTLPHLWRANPAEAKIATDDVRRLNSEALAEIRQLLMEYRDEAPETYSFVHHLKNVVEGVQERFKITVELEVEGDASLPENVRLAFLRVVQECLANSAKHANAQNIHVYFDGMTSQALISIRDDGDGFNDQDIPLGSLGLQIMKERIAIIKGSLEVSSKHGSGTVVTAIWMNQSDQGSGQVD